ncbi:MAG: hypothetical protein MUO26_05985 [Methanotrichaceae archaeon]|nr:hypothetical protein [Methanotrichaceae archaeon]
MEKATNDLIAQCFLKGGIILKPSPSCSNHCCDVFCEHYQPDYECGVYFCDLNATGGCVDFM